MSVAVASTAPRGISADQLTDLARTIVNRTETDTQRDCIYCHMDSDATTCLKEAISAWNHSQRVSLSFDIPQPLIRSLDTFNVKVIYAGAAVDYRSSMNLVCVAKIKWLDAESTEFYRVGFDVGAVLMPTLDQIFYCPKCGRRLVDKYEFSQKET